MKLTSADSFEINGKTVYTFHGIPDLNPRTLLRQDVEIDGSVFRVINVETFAVVDPTGFSFGLMVVPL